MEITYAPNVRAKEKVKEGLGMPFISQYKFIETFSGRASFLKLMNETAKEGWKPVWNTKEEDPMENHFSIYLYRKCKVNKLINDGIGN